MKSLTGVIAIDIQKRNKIKGAIYGFAIGDAMGATTEFMTEKQIKTIFGKVTNIIGGGWLNLKAGEITDDTEMTMCVMDAIMKALISNDSKTREELFINCCIRNFIDWYKSNPKDIGGQCSKAINLLMRGYNVPEDELALGNGSLMRAMPLALLNLPYTNELQGRLTHNNDECSNIIIEYTRLVQEYLNDNYIYLYNNIGKSLQRPSGCILNTFNNSVYWSRKNSFEEAIIGAVNHGGDADTIAAITGSLAGAKFGYDKIPKRWIEQLNPEVKNFLENYKYFVFTYVQI